jgi:hypothetical protein
MSEEAPYKIQKPSNPSVICHHRGGLKWYSTSYAIAVSATNCLAALGFDHIVEGTALRGLN